MAYLTEEEIVKYCTVIPGVTTLEVEIASQLINGYKGRSYEPKEVTEMVQLNNKCRGKLKQTPIIGIVKVYGYMQNMFGLSKEELAVNDIVLDPEGDGYFTYIGSGGINSIVFNSMPRSLEITYRTGYEVYPENLKIATAMLAQNIKQRSSFAGEKSINSLDFRVEMTDDSFFTSDIKMLLRSL